jgi:thioredoxin
MNSTVKAVSTASFPAEVLHASSDQPVLVDFWAPWCGPCRALGPVLEQVAAEQGEKVKVVKVNTDENQDLAQQYQIRSIPAVKLFRGGRVVAEFVGAQPLGAVRSFLEPHLPRASEGEHRAARELAAGGDYAGAIGKLRVVTEQDPSNLDARRDLARYLALSGDVVGASKVLGQLPPQAQSDPESNAVRALIHFAALASDDAARGRFARLGGAFAARWQPRGPPSRPCSRACRATAPSPRAPGAKTCCRRSRCCRRTMQGSTAGGAGWRRCSIESRDRLNQQDRFS